MGGLKVSMTVFCALCAAKGRVNVEKVGNLKQQRHELG